VDVFKILPPVLIALVLGLVQYQASPYANYDHQWPTNPEKIKSVAKLFSEGDAYLAVCLKETNNFIGFVSLNPVKREEPGGWYNIRGLVRSFPDYPDKHQIEGVKR
jgi:hypothetical protein